MMRSCTSRWQCQPWRCRPRRATRAVWRTCSTPYSTQQAAHNSHYAECKVECVCFEDNRTGTTARRGCRFAGHGGASGWLAARRWRTHNAHPGCCARNETVSCCCCCWIGPGRAGSDLHHTGNATKPKQQPDQCPNTDCTQHSDPLTAQMIVCIEMIVCIDTGSKRVRKLTIARDRLARAQLWVLPPLKCPQLTAVRLQ